MDYTLKDTIKLVEQFEAELQKSNQYDHNIESFKALVADQITEETVFYWNCIGKERKIREHQKVQSAHLLFHMNRYAKTYFKIYH